MRKAFYVRCPRETEPPSTSLCTSLHIIIPDGILYSDAVEMICEQVNAEFRRYMVHEVLRGLGVKPQESGE